MIPIKIVISDIGKSLRWKVFIVGNRSAELLSKWNHPELEALRMLADMEQRQ